MSKTFWQIAAVLFACMTGISQWHMGLIIDEQVAVNEGWNAVGAALVERIEERDAYIHRLEDIIIDLNAIPEIDTDA